MHPGRMVLLPAATRTTPSTSCPARLFLGDSGALLIGFVIAVIAIQSSSKLATVVAILAPGDGGGITSCRGYADNAAENATRVAHQEFKGARFPCCFP
jgi:hypothetical protein